MVWPRPFLFCRLPGSRYSGYNYGMISWKREPITLPIPHCFQQLLQRDAPLVECGAYYRPDDAGNPRERRNVLFSTHAAAGDGRQVRSVVAANISKEEGAGPRCPALLSSA